MGARPLRRAIQRYIEDPLADFVLRAELVPGATVMVSRAPEGEDPEVSLSVVEPKKVPAAVGGGSTEESNEGEPQDEPAAPTPPPAADAEQS
jgi:ATP-dependent Clp protease ATP-binding subunit ClpC